MGGLYLYVRKCLEEGFDVGGKAMKQSKSALWSMCSRKSNVMLRCWSTSEQRHALFLRAVGTCNNLDA